MHYFIIYIIETSKLYNTTKKADVTIKIKDIIQENETK